MNTIVGPVLLDFPYVFELDDKKLYCDVTLPNGSKCNGVIDYDNGFNNLVCTKCGKLHLATSLKKENSSIKIISEGDEVKMKVVIKRGRDVIKSFDSGTDTIVRDRKKNDVDGVERTKLKVRITGRDEDTLTPDTTDFKATYSEPRNTKTNSYTSDIKIDKHAFDKSTADVDIDQEHEYEKHKIQSKAHIVIDGQENEGTTMHTTVEERMKYKEAIERDEKIKERHEAVKKDIDEIIKEEMETNGIVENPNITENAELLSKYNLSEDDFNDDTEEACSIDDKDRIEEKYAHLEEEYGDTSREKIINTKDLY